MVMQGARFSAFEGFGLYPVADYSWWRDCCVNRAVKVTTIMALLEAYHLLLRIAIEQLFSSLTNKLAMACLLISHLKLLVFPKGLL